MADVYSTNELDDLNFGFEYDDIISQEHKPADDLEGSDVSGKQTRYYDIHDILAYNNKTSNYKYKDVDSYSVASSPDMAYFFSPSSVNYKLWLKQQVQGSW